MEEVLLRYPNVKAKTLATGYSAIQKSKIEVQEVKQAGRIIRFTILINGVSSHTYFVSKMENAKSVS
jgi:hypothetical protein